MTVMMKHAWSAVTVCWILLFPGHMAWGLEFSAEQTVRNGTQSTKGKIYFKADRWRVEMASPDGSKVAIHRLDKVATWLLLPNRTYVELPLRFDQIPPLAPKIEGETERKPVGSEKIGGRNTEKYEVTVDMKGRKTVMYQWVAADIKIPMKTAAADGSWESVYKYVKEGPQPAHLFELPAGYTKASMKR